MAKRRKTINTNHNTTLLSRSLSSPEDPLFATASFNVLIQYIRTFSHSPQRAERIAADNIRATIAVVINPRINQWRRIRPTFFPFAQFNCFSLFPYINQLCWIYFAGFPKRATGPDRQVHCDRQRTAPQTAGHRPFALLVEKHLDRRWQTGKNHCCCTFCYVCAHQ